MLSASVVRRIPSQFATLSCRRFSSAQSSLAPLSAALPKQLSRKWKGTDTFGGETKNFIGGEWVGGFSGVQASGAEWIEVKDPSTQGVLTRVPNTPVAQVDLAIKKAKDAWTSTGWKDSTVLQRQGVMMKYAALIKEHLDDLAQSIVLEQGKTMADARGDVTRGLQVIETCISVPSLLKGEKIEVSKDMDTETRLEPLGVGAAICPFNFPAMIPLWSIGMALATGNALVVKPSERDPGAASILTELATKAGIPAGILSSVNGSKQVVSRLCQHEDIQAVSFVGGDRAGRAIWEEATKHGKRAQCNLGAKNHAILMPDANKNFALNSLAGAAFGAAGQRCMALSVLIAVGDTTSWLPELIERAKTLKVNNGFEQGTDLGPVISPEARQRIETLIASCEEEGGKILLDGRGAKVDGYPDGNWVGPTVLEARLGMKCYEEEIFGPALVVLKADTLDEAIEIINKNKYGNGSAIFTQSGATARLFERTCGSGQIGINVPIPVPLPMFSWSGNKGSVLGGSSLYGSRGFDFWTQLKTTTALWRSADALHNQADVAMPVHR